MALPPELAAIACGIAANTCTGLFGSVIDLARNKQLTFDEILKSEVEDFCSSFEWHGEIPEEEIALFFQSPEFEFVLSQWVSAHLLAEDQSTSFSSLLESYRKCAIRFFGNADLNFDELTKLIKAYWQAIWKGLNRAVESGHLVALARIVDVRMATLQAMLESIEASLVRREEEQLPSKEKMEELIGEYRRLVPQRLGKITPPHPERTTKVELKALYVTPSFSADNRDASGVIEGDVVEEKQAYRQLVGDAMRLVVLGDPGGGKSTFAKKVCADAAASATARLVGGRRLVPFLVVLRDYGLDRYDDKLSLCEHIVRRVKLDYDLNITETIIDHILRSGLGLVVFDGLDELVDAHKRREITDDIENFCERYPGCPIIVTSRKIGYAQAPLDDKRFQTCILSEFDESQVREYVTNWFNLASDLTEAQAQEKVEGFLDESESVDDLRRNPLVLSLMCQLYRGRNYIPQNRTDVYDSCSNMLIEQWDKGRLIPLPPEIEEISSHVRPTLYHIAHWIYSDPNLQSGVVEEQLVKKTAEYLNGRRWDSSEDSLRSAKAFVAYCKGRAWVITEAGTTARGVSLFQFTHRTFLEYYTACFLVRNYSTTDSLISVLLPWIHTAKSDIVSQLSVHLFDRQVQDGADALLEKLLEEASAVSGSECLNVMSFLSRSLHELVPSPRTVRHICNLVVDAFVVKAPDSGNGSADNWHILHDLVILLSTNAPNVVRSCYERLEEIIGDPLHEPTTKSRAVDIACYAFKIATNPLRRSKDSAIPWLKALKDTIACLDGGSNSLKLESPFISITLFHAEELSFEELLDAHGSKWLLGSVRITRTDGPMSFYGSLIDWLAWTILPLRSNLRVELHATELSETKLSAESNFEYLLKFGQWAARNLTPLSKLPENFHFSPGFAFYLEDILESQGRMSALRVNWLDEWGNRMRVSNVIRFALLVMMLATKRSSIEITEQLISCREIAMKNGGALRPLIEVIDIALAVIGSPTGAKRLQYLEEVGFSAQQSSVIQSLT